MGSQWTDQHDPPAPWLLAAVVSLVLWACIIATVWLVWP